MGSILCLEKTNDSLNISYNLPKRGECVQLLLAHFPALNSQISYCTPFGCRKQTLKGNLQLAKSSGQRRFKLQRKKGSRAGVNSKESFLEEGDIKASLHNELALMGGQAIRALTAGNTGEAVREPASSGEKWVCSLLPFISPSSSVLLHADLERTRKAQRR